MNISVKSEYALKALFDLASQQNDERRSATAVQPVKIDDIAQLQKIPQKFLQLIIDVLKQNGFVDSRRGAEGGYLLARKPESITVGEVIRSIENVRSSNRANCRDAFADVWDRVDKAVSEVLDQMTFAELARDWREKNSKYVPNWDI